MIDAGISLPVIGILAPSTACQIVHQAQPDFGVSLILDHAADAVQVELNR